MLIKKFLFIFYLCSRTPPPPHPHPPKEKKTTEKDCFSALFTQWYNYAVWTGNSLFLFFSFSVAHSAYIYQHYICYLSSLLMLKKNCTCDVKIHTSFMMHLPQGIYNILCFAKVYIIQSISHLVFHFLKKEKEKNMTE